MCTRLAIVYTFGWLLLASGWLRLGLSAVPQN
jgi:hypothetical protein